MTGPIVSFFNLLTITFHISKQKILYEGAEMFGITDAQKANMLRGQMIRARQCGQTQVAADKWRALNELQNPDVGADVDPEEDQKYREMIIRNSRGDKNAE